MANFATVSVASAIRLIATIPTALMAAIRSPICPFTSTPRTEWELLSTALAPGPSGSPCRETRLRGFHRAAGVTGAGSGIICISVCVETYGTKP
jgi:hypothetical protein